MVMPVVFAVILVIMYLMFFRYNRCLMEQECGLLLVRGTAVEEETAEARVQRTDALSRQTVNSLHLIWTQEPYRIRQERGKLFVGTGGEMCFPFAGWQLEGISDRWQAKVTYQSPLLSPTFLVRSCRKVLDIVGKD